MLVTNCLNKSCSNQGKSSQSFGAGRIRISGDSVELVITNSLKKKSLFNKELVEAGDANRLTINPWGYDSPNDVTIENDLVKGWTEDLRNLGQKAESSESGFIEKLAKGLKALTETLSSKDPQKLCEEGYRKLIDMLESGTARGQYDSKSGNFVFRG